MRRGIRSEGEAAVRERGGRCGSAAAEGTAAGGEASKRHWGSMAELRARRDAYRATVVYRLGRAGGAGVQWRRTTVCPRSHPTDRFGCAQEVEFLFAAKPSAVEIKAK